VNQRSRMSSEFSIISEVDIRAAPTPTHHVVASCQPIAISPIFATQASTRWRLGFLPLATRPGRRAGCDAAMGAREERKSPTEEGANAEAPATAAAAATK